MTKLITTIALSIFLIGCNTVPPRRHFKPVIKKPDTFDEKRFNCIYRLSKEFIQFSSITEITTSCESVVICKGCK